MHRRHVVVLAPLAAASAALGNPSSAQAEMAPASEDSCRECLGLGVVPCERLLACMPAHTPCFRCSWLELAMDQAHAGSSILL